eukprot:scaffold291111_cov166-Cyclotella_meneghiniana.AAC.1
MPRTPWTTHMSGFSSLTEYESSSLFLRFFWIGHFCFILRTVFRSTLLDVALTWRPLAVKNLKLSVVIALMTFFPD